MKKPYLKVLVLFASIMTYSHLQTAEYKNSAEVIKAINDAYEKMIPASQNIFKMENATRKANIDAWKETISATALYIKTALEKERLNKKSLVGISQDNINLFNDAQKVIKIFSDDVVETILKLANTKVRDVEWESDLKALSQRTSMLKELQKKLAPKTLDIATSKDIKKILTLLASLLEKAVPKISKDYVAFLSNQKQDLALNLLKAIKGSNVEEVRNILANKALDINYMSTYEKTATISALGMALEQGNLEIIDMILAKKPKLEAIFKAGNKVHSALSMAIMNNAVADNTALVQKILNQNPKPNLEKTYTDKGKTYSALGLITYIKDTDKRFRSDNAFKAKLLKIETLLNPAVKHTPAPTTSKASSFVDQNIKVVLPQKTAKQRSLLK